MGSLFFRFFLRVRDSFQRKDTMFSMAVSVGQRAVLVSDRVCTFIVNDTARRFVSTDLREPLRHVGAFCFVHYGADGCFGRFEDGFGLSRQDQAIYWEGIYFFRRLSFSFLKGRCTQSACRPSIILAVDVSSTFAGGNALAVGPISVLTNFRPPRTMSPLVPNSISSAHEVAMFKESAPVISSSCVEVLASVFSFE